MKTLTQTIWHFALACAFVIMGSVSGTAFAQASKHAEKPKEAQQQTQHALSIKNRAEFDVVRQKAEAGDMQSQYRLAIAYSDGVFVKADDKLMVEWLGKAAGQGHAEAQFYLAGMYAKGIGVMQDYQQAATWMRKAAEKGVDMAQYNLGNMYEAGIGVQKNQKEALVWYRKSAAQGNPYARQRMEELGAATGKPKPAARK